MCDDGICDKCKDGDGLAKCKHCVDSNCPSCGLWWPTDDDRGGCDGSCMESLHEAFKTLTDDQEPLGAEFEKVLHENLHELYES